jgi:nucleotide-binding universal stress UspA family protein
MKIVVAFNESEDARAAVAWAAELGRRPGAEVHLVHAVPPPAIPAFSSPHAVEDLMNAATAAATKAVEAAVASLKAKNVAASCSVRRWLVVDSVLSKADELHADLVVVGRRGSTRATQLLIGTISSEIVRLSRASVLVVRHDGPPQPRGNVLVAVDGSRPSVEAAKVARATFPEARLVLVHVEHGSGAGPDVPRKVASSAGLDPKSVDLRELAGDPASEILSLLGSEPFAAVVLGPRGLGALAGLLLGSVSEKVLQLARQPVLIAR